MDPSEIFILTPLYLVKFHAMLNQPNCFNSYGLQKFTLPFKIIKKFPEIECVCMLTLILCNGMDCSPPGSSVHGISQSRIPERINISYSRGSFWPRVQTHVSCIPCIGHWATWEACKRIKKLNFHNYYLCKCLLFEDSIKSPLLFHISTTLKRKSKLKNLKV